MDKVKLAQQQLELQQRALEEARSAEQALALQVEKAIRELADAHIESLLTAPREVQAKVLRYFRERERGAAMESSINTSGKMSAAVSD